MPEGPLPRTAAAVLSVGASPPAGEGPRRRGFPSPLAASCRARSGEL